MGVHRASPNLLHEPIVASNMMSAASQRPSAGYPGVLSSRRAVHSLPRPASTNVVHEPFVAPRTTAAPSSYLPYGSYEASQCNRDHLAIHRGHVPHSQSMMLRSPTLPMTTVPMRSV